MTLEVSKDCPLGIENREKIKALDRRVGVNETYINGIFVKLDDINKSLMGRPTWRVTAIFSILTGLCGSMLTLIVRYIMLKQ